MLREGSGGETDDLILRRNLEFENLGKHVSGEGTCPPVE
jgi:hypothetical protein